MQTFLPYSDFEKTSKVLDYRRLGKQRLEARDCLVILTQEKLNILDNQFFYINKKYKNHPVVKLWKGYEEALKLYINNIIEEWINRGYNNSQIIYDINYNNLIYPHWLGNEKFHSSHRAALLCKNYDWYSQFNWREKPKINYYWRVTNEHNRRNSQDNI